MTVFSKLIEKFKKKPESIKFRELEKILLSIGFEKIPTKGSHMKYKKSNFEIDIIIPVHKNDCKDFYKKQTYKIIKNLL